MGSDFGHLVQTLLPILQKSETMSRLPEQARNIILPGISGSFCLSCFRQTANRRAESRPSDLHPQCFPRTAFAEKKEAEVSPPPPVSLMQSRRGLTHIASVLGSAAPPTHDKVNTNFEVTRKGGRPPASPPPSSSPFLKKLYGPLPRSSLFFPPPPLRSIAYVWGRRRRRQEAVWAN